MSEVNNNLLNEIWKPIPDYELEYAVSNLGRVKRLKESTARRRYPAGMILTNSIANNKYEYVRLAGKIKKQHYIHRLVMLAFVGECPPNQEVNHINGIRNDNRLINLEYVTRSENNLHAYALGRKAIVPIGSKNHNWKVSDEDVRLIRIQYANGETYASLAKKYNIDWTSVKSIVKKETHKYVI